VTAPRAIVCGPASTARIAVGLLERAPDELVSPSGRFLLVSSAGSAPVADHLRRSLRGRILLDLVIDDREEAKTLEGVERIAHAALEAGVRRDDAFVAVGGGVVSDIAGFAAAVVLRGIAWNVVPTTTGAMADAAIGGKTGVDTKAGKNLIGAFHPPRAILIDPAALKTLPDRDFRAGLVEAFKAAWIADAALAERAEKDVAKILAREEKELMDLIAGAVAVKAAIVTDDLRESDRRRLLNFGHTLGHAFEAAGGYRKLKHGEAVAWGIAAAVEISTRRSGLAAPAVSRIRATLSALGPFPEPDRDPKALASYLALDKKATARGVAGVLLEAIGRARVEESVPTEEWLTAARAARLSPDPSISDLT
jgi:3-dehydroquinate synthase